MIGIDWQTPLGWAWERLEHAVAVQGNLDPTVLFAPQEVLSERVDEVLRQAGGQRGHIFNLGHGILPETPVANVRRVVDWVHERTRQAQHERSR